MEQILSENIAQDRRTNIICTIDESKNGSVEMLGQMIDAGMNVARINFDSRTE